MLEKRENLLFFKTFPVIKTSELILRDIQLKDARQFFEIRSDERVMKYMDRESFQSMDDSKKMINSCIETYEKGSGINWAITLKDSINKCANNHYISREKQPHTFMDKKKGGIIGPVRDELIGYVGFWKWVREHFRAEVGFALLPAYWGKGIMYEALDAIIKFGFEKMNLHRIEADVNPDNIPSIKLLEKLNFKQEAYYKENIFLNGKFCDSAIYSLLNPYGRK